MKRRKFITVGFVALAAVVFAIGAGGVSGATKSNITVWLQVDARSGWADIVAAADDSRPGSLLLAPVPEPACGAADRSRGNPA